MFNWLSHQIPARPKSFIVFWIIVGVLGASGALIGFGQGNLFERMSSSESMVPGSQSDKVLHATGPDARGENVIVLVENTQATEIADDLARFRTEIADIAHIDSVNDPITVDQTFQENIAKSIDMALAKAVAENQELIDHAVSQALESSAPLLAQARAVGGPDAEVAARNEITSKATEQATKAIADEARKSAAQHVQTLANPVDAFRHDNAFLIVITLDKGHYPDTIAEVKQATDTFGNDLRNHDESITVSALSGTLAKDTILDQTEKDLVIGEVVGLPIALILLVVVFGGAIAAGLPLGSALVSIAIGLGAVWSLTFVTNVDNFILNIVTLIGLALSIDYGLLVVSRYREEISHRTSDPDDPHLSEHIAHAVEKTIMTSGRTVAFSALTIALAIAGLLFMNAPMLRMIAIGGVIVTLLAVASAITLVPALIVIAGRKLVAPSILSRSRFIRALFIRFGDSASDHGVFSRLAHWVRRRPWQILISTSALLILIASPIFTLNLRSNFIDYLPNDSDEKHVFMTLEDDFPEFSTPEITVLAQTSLEGVTSFIEQAQALPHVIRAHEPVATADGVIIGFDVDTTDPVGPNVTSAVSDMRDLETDFDVFVGGAAALQVDFTSSIAFDAPIALGVVILAVVILLFFMTGSLIAPLTALVINSLSLLAGLGGAEFLFSHGLLGLPRTNGLETFVVASAVAFGFGLAMDYEVFLLARIKEYWDAGESNDMAVEHGLQRSGRIITSAAAIIIAVFIGFVFGQLVAIKQIGVVLAIIVAVDATLVRMLLVPAMMTILGKWNWWAPRPLAALHRRFGINH